MDNQQVNILGEIRQGFSQRRGHRVPMELRELALSGLRRGQSPGSVARAAGISPQSLASWKKAIKVKRALPVLRPVELKVKPTSDEGTARITLISGAKVEIPVQFLDVRWLIALNGSAS